MANVDLTIINAALTRTGNNPITALTDNAIGATIALANYETMVRAELASNPWKIAKKIAVLDLIDPDVEGIPPEPWLYSYTLPTDLVDLAVVKVAGLPVDYSIFGRILLANVSGDSTLVAHYTWRVEEIYWPAWFAEGMTMRLEALFLRSIGERHDEGKARDMAADAQFTKSRNRDAQLQTARNPMRSPILQARRGGVAVPSTGWWPNAQN